MELYLLRHGIAAAQNTGSYATDADRPLTPEGESQMHQVASGMKALGLSFDLIVSSPYLRAKQTAKIVAEILGIPKTIQFSDHLLPGGSFQRLTRDLSTRLRDYNQVALVGHEPHLSQLISILLTGGPELSIEIKKGGLCKLTVDKFEEDSPCATLNWLMTSDELGLMSR